MIKDSQQIQNNSGYVTLVSVLVVGAVAFAVAVSLIWLGMGSSRSSFANEQSSQAWALTNACVEEGLQQIRNFTPFSGYGGLALGQGTCGYFVTNTGGNNRTINASSTVGTIIRKSTVTVTAISPAIVINSWQEVAD